MEAAARTAILLSQYAPVTYTANATFYANKVADYTSRINAAANWLLLPATTTLYQHGSASFTSRQYSLANALGEAAQLTGSSDQANAAMSYANLGLAMQQADGSNPENGISSVNAQVYGLASVENYLPYCPDPTLKANLLAMLSRGLRWEEQWIDINGNVTGTTNPATHAIAGAFDTGSQLTQDNSFEVFTYRINKQ